MSSWCWGIVIALTGSTCGAFGDIAVRRALLLAKAEGDVRWRSVATALANGSKSTAELLSQWRKADSCWRPRGWAVLWAVGFLCTSILEDLFGFIALLFAPAALITPLMSVHIAASLIFSYLWLHEALRRNSLVCIVATIIGVTITAMSAGKESTINSLDDLRLVFSPDHISFWGRLVFLLSLVAGYTSLFFVEHRLSLTLISGCSGGLAEIFSKPLCAALVDMRTHGMLVVLESFLFWAVFLVFVPTLILGIVYLNAALEASPAMIVIAVSNSAVLLLGSLGSTVLLGEIPDSISSYLLGLFIVTCATTALFRTGEKKSERPVLPPAVIRPRGDDDPVGLMTPATPLVTFISFKWLKSNNNPGGGFGFAEEPKFANQPPAP